MYCTNCGNALPENSSFCPNCGTQIQSNIQQAMYQQPPAMYQQPPAMYQQLTQKKKSKAPWIALGVSLFLLLVIVAIVVVLLISCSNDVNKSPDTVTKNAFESLMKDDAGTFFDAIYPSKVSEYIYETGYSKAEIFDELQNSFFNKFDTSSMKLVSFTVSGYDHYSSEDVEWANEEYEIYKDYILITAAMDVYGTMTVRTDDGSLITCSWDADVVYADGKYYIDELDMNY